jgi:hypothetical protein
MAGYCMKQKATGEETIIIYVGLLDEFDKQPT